MGVEFLDPIEQILGIVSEIVGLVSTVLGLIWKKKSGNKFAVIPIVFGLIIIISTGLYAFRAYYTQKIEIIQATFNEETEKAQDIRHKLTSIGFELNKLVNNYDAAIDETNHFQKADIRILQNEANILYNDLKLFSDSELDLALKIYRHDNLGYVALILSSLESLAKNSQRAIYWANESISESEIALKELYPIFARYEKQGDKSYKTIYQWLRADDTRNRLHYLLAWANAIKFYNSDGETTITIVANHIDSIKTSNYLDEYPLASNIHFRRIEGQFNENLRTIYFSKPDTL